MPVLLWSQATGLVAALVAIPFLSHATLTPSSAIYGALAGIVGASGLFVLYRGIANTVVAVVSPVSALVGAVVPMVFGLLAGEEPSTVALCGAGLCLPATFLLAFESGGGTSRAVVRSALLHGVAAGAGFGAFFILLSLTGEGTGLWPLVSARAATLLLAGAYLVSRRESLAISQGNRLIVILTGLLDMAANIAFLLAARAGMLSLVTAVVGLYPGPTVILARVVFGERLCKVRTAGVVLAIVGVVLIGYGG